jgi:hypothetical protein
MSDENWIELGYGCAYQPEFADDGTVTGILFRHPYSDTCHYRKVGWWGGEFCQAHVSFDGPTPWTLDSFDPLNVSPSILCMGDEDHCGGAHGFIRSGHWVPC